MSCNGGSDGIPASLVVYDSKEVLLSYLKLFSLSMDYGTYPSVCKADYHL